MLMCPDCGNPLDGAGFTNCNRPADESCIYDRGRFMVRVHEIVSSTSLPALAKMEENQMPECYTPTREAVVALATMLMSALRQNQEMAEHLRALRRDLH